ERELLEARQARASGEVKVSDAAAELRVAIELIDKTAYPLEGVINFRAVQIDPATGTAEVRAEVANPEQALLPGQFVRARVLGLTRHGVLSVPQRAVQMGAQSSFVYVVGAGDKVESRDVLLTSWEGPDWVLESGLKEGERVVVDGTQKIRPGDVVKPVETSPKK
ncbi:MAG: efflux RND transporter periplasmic adaptor subunit, partial [Planctomycetota bacterium]